MPCAAGSNSTLSVAKALLEAGADVNRADKDRRSPLHYAVNATTGGFEVLTEVEGLLVNYGADTSAVDIRGRTPLHYSFVKRKRFVSSSLRCCSVLLRLELAKLSRLSVRTPA